MESISGFGTSYEKPISFAKCKELLKPHKTPKIGYEADVSTMTDAFGFKHRLVAQNISNRIVLASSSVEKHDWKEIFGINA